VVTMAGSEQSLFCHRGSASGAHDDVIQDAHIYESQCIFQPAGDRGIVPAGLGNTAGVVVGKNHGRGIQLQAAPDYHAGIDTGSIDGTPEEALEGDQGVAGIEEQAAEVFIPLQADL